MLEFSSSTNGMNNLRQYMGQFLLRVPAPLHRIRHLPVFGGLIHRLTHSLLPSGEKVWARVTDGPAEGMWMELNPRTGHSYLLGNSEPAVQRLLAEWLHPGMVFYDLGANIGLYSLLGARMVGPAGRVFSFEPDFEVAKRLRANIARNSLSNVTVVEAGIWSQSGEANFEGADLSSPDHGTGRFIAGGQGTPIRCVRLDDFIQKSPPPQVIKCDVEGAEIEVLRGAELLLKRHRPRILCETHSETNDRVSRDLLSRAGYRVESLDDNHILAISK